jgi:tetraacyldisaccharide 4'-kinase
MKAQRPWAWPLVPFYAAVRAIKSGLRTTGMLQPRKLQWPVVSVGSLSAGGAGKTPVVMALAELLREHNWSVDILTRGYGREGRGVEQVDPEANEAARRFGDEPVMMARRLRIPVWVGADRFAAGTAAEALATGGQEPGQPLRDDNQRFLTNGKQKRVHLLDDGFQHRKLARAMDIVLVTAADLEDVLLPAGNLREPLTILWKADAVVLREEERERIEPHVRRLMRQSAEIWTIRRTVDFRGAVEGPDRPKGLVAFCAIARPDDFFQTLRSAGGRAVHSQAFPDHHRYTADDIRRLAEACRSQQGDAFITTEKDAVKLTKELRARLEATAPLLVARLQTAFVDPGQVLHALEARLQ